MNEKELVAQGHANTRAVISQLEQAGYRVLAPFTGSIEFAPRTAEMRIKKALVLDTETTGRDATGPDGKPLDKIIEMGIVEFEYDEITGQVLGITGGYNGFEDPLMPIPPEASRVNGISDEMVAGQRFDDEQINALVKGASFVIAHNSSFDREFCELRFESFKAIPWACSRAQIDWEVEQVGGQKLDYIAYRYGFHYSAHRAEIDCLALLNILAKPLPVTPLTGLGRLVSKVNEKTLRVYALNASFDSKDLLSKRGYRWGPSLKTDRPEKAWYMELTVENLDSELQWLKTEVFKNSRFAVRIDEIDGFSRFSRRVSHTASKYC